MESDTTAISDLRQRTMPDVLRRLGEGEGLATICRGEGMPDRETVRRWSKADAGLAEQIEQARQDGLTYRAEKAVEAVKKATDPQMARLIFDAERWYLGKISNAFAERPASIDSQTNVQVNINGASPFGALAELLERAAATIAGGATSTHFVADNSSTGPDCPAGGLDNLADQSGQGVG